MWRMLCEEAKEDSMKALFYKNITMFVRKFQFNHS